MQRQYMFSTVYKAIDKGDKRLQYIECGQFVV
jgi:hypothetical protein